MEFNPGGCGRPGLIDWDRQPFVTNMTALAEQNRLRIAAEMQSGIGPYAMFLAPAPGFILHLDGTDYVPRPHPRYGFVFEAPLKAVNAISMKQIPIDAKGNWVQLSFRVVTEQTGHFE